MLKWIAPVFFLATPALAQDLRPVPAYFADTIFDLATAQALATSCAEIDVNEALSVDLSNALLVRLAEDGFDVDAPESEMDNPADVLGKWQTTYVARMGLMGAGTEQVCRVARIEIGIQSGIGRLLYEVDQ